MLCNQALLAIRVGRAAGCRPYEAFLADAEINKLADAEINTLTLNILTALNLKYAVRFDVVF